MLAGPAAHLHAPHTTDLALAASAAAANAFAAHAEQAEQRREAALQEGLTRAGRTLQESLDLTSLLMRVCREAAGVVEADGAVLFRARARTRSPSRPLYGFPPELVGWTASADADASVIGEALAAERPVLAAEPPAEHPAWDGAAATVAAPVDWDGRLRGVLCATYRDPGRPTRAHADALATFAELAGAVFANASAHTGLAMTARTDALTGCLNHAALHDGLRREVERAAARAGAHVCRSSCSSWSCPTPAMTPPATRRCAAPGTRSARPRAPTTSPRATAASPSRSSRSRRTRRRPPRSPRGRSRAWASRSTTSPRTPAR